MSKAEEKTTELMKKAGEYLPDGGYSEKELNLAFFMFIKGYHQAIEDACEWIKQQQEMLEDCFSDAGDFADLLKQAMKDE